MSEFYLGHLSHNDRLFDYLRWEIFPKLDCDCCDGIRVFGTNGSNAVYIYEDRKKCRKVVGKFFCSAKQQDRELARKRCSREYNNIMEIRHYLGRHHYVALPLGVNDDLGSLLVVEYCCGKNLDAFIVDAIKNNGGALLYEKLTALAGFLATVHNKSAQGRRVDFFYQCHYFSCMLRAIEDVTSRSERDSLWQLCRLWRHDWAVWQDQEVLVHGDATPSNFLFGDGLYVVSFDMERVRRADRCLDVGRIAAELQHFFMLFRCGKSASEPFVAHFIREYCCHFPDRDSAFSAVCRRLPFYMGVTLLRIARNRYLDEEYRKKLVREAFCTLDRSWIR